MADKVKPLKIENPALGGSETDPFPTEADPNEDYITGKGFAFENNDDRLLDLSVSGEMQFKDAIQTSYWPIWKNKYALYNVFDPSATDLVSINTEAAIKELWSRIGQSSKGYILASYNGNAGTGRYLEFFNGIDSSIAPIYSATGLKIIEIVAATTAVNATCTIGFYNLTTSTLLYTATFSAVKRIYLSGALFTLPTAGQLMIKIDSGSIAKPHLQLVAQGL